MIVYELISDYQVTHFCHADIPLENAPKDELKVKSHVFKLFG